LGAIDTDRRKIRDHTSISTCFLREKSPGGNRKLNVARDSYLSLAVGDISHAQIARPSSAIDSASRPHRRLVLKGLTP
jgi:hypothetical protein